MGVSTLHDRFSTMENEAEQFEAMSRHFEDHLARFAPAQPAMSKSVTPRLQIIGVSGTATTFGALHLGLKNYDRARVDGLWLPTESAAEIATQILEMGPGRIDHPGIGANRAKLILSGTAILSTILRLWPVERIRVADRGLREGLLYGMLHQRRIAAQ